MSTNGFSEEISEGSADAETSLGAPILSRNPTTTWMSPVLELRLNVERLVCLCGDGGLCFWNNNCHVGASLAVVEMVFECAVSGAKMTTSGASAKATALRRDATPDWKQKPVLAEHAEC